MTSMTITSITLPASIVQQVLSAHLNAQFLRIPHTVTGVELLDDQFVVTLEPAPEPAPVVTTTAPAVWTYLDTATPTLPTNGNGNSHTADKRSSSVSSFAAASCEAATEVTPAEAPKRRSVTPEEDAEILRLHAEGYPLSRIAEATGIRKGTIDYRIKRHAANSDGAA